MAIFNGTWIDAGAGPNAHMGGIPVGDKAKGNRKHAATVVNVLQELRSHPFPAKDHHFGQWP